MPKKQPTTHKPSALKAIKPFARTNKYCIQAPYRWTVKPIFLSVLL